MDVAKAIQKASGVEPTGYKENKDGRFYGGGDWNETPRQLFMPEPEGEAKQWQGWGTALKPALEPIVVARKPLIGTVAENVLTHGTGGLNIDASRIGTEERTNLPAANKQDSKGVYKFSNDKVDAFNGTEATTVQGRWPANLILDEYTADLLDEQSGNTKSTIHPRGGGSNFAYQGGWGDDLPKLRGIEDSGGASRFFYVAKASKRDRNEGLEELLETTAADMVEREPDSAGMNSPRAGASRTSGAKNFHPTVKPTALMQYLVKLVTPPGGTVLDPFTGSGSTGKAAILEGFDFIGIELTEDYWPIIEGRLKHAEAKVAEAKENIEAQPQGLF
jgi:site-specific DNA-methyltransferase (adenine-specific)